VEGQATSSWPSEETKTQITEGPPTCTHTSYWVPGRRCRFTHTAPRTGSLLCSHAAGQETDSREHHTTHSSNVDAQKTRGSRVTATWHTGPSAHQLTFRDARGVVHSPLQRHQSQPHTPQRARLKKGPNCGRARVSSPEAHGCRRTQQALHGACVEGGAAVVVYMVWCERVHDNVCALMCMGACVRVSGGGGGGRGWGSASRPSCRHARKRSTPRRPRCGTWPARGATRT
jgi:hypothetical protein